MYKRQAMHRAVDQLNVRPQHLLIDGNRFKKYRDLPHTTVVKGDGKYPVSYTHLDVYKRQLLFFMKVS